VTIKGSRATVPGGWAGATGDLPGGYLLPACYRILREIHCHAKFPVKGKASGGLAPRCFGVVGFFSALIALITFCAAGIPNCVKGVPFRCGLMTPWNKFLYPLYVDGRFSFSTEGRYASSINCAKERVPDAPASGVGSDVGRKFPLSLDDAQQTIPSGRNLSNHKQRHTCVRMIP
jgi:hypothetical protein